MIYAISVKETVLLFMFIMTTVYHYALNFQSKEQTLSNSYKLVRFVLYIL